MYGVSRDKEGKQLQFEATLKSCGVCTVRKRLLWNHGRNLSSNNGGQHRPDCPKKPGHTHPSSSTVAVCAPLWLLDKEGRRVEQLTVEEYEQKYHPKGKKSAT